MLDALESDFKLRRLKSLKQTRGHVRVVRKAFGDLRALDVTPNIVNRYIESELANGKAPATVNRRTSLLGEAFRLAVRRRQLSVMPEIPRLGENNARRGFFDKAEFDSVVSNLPWYLKGFVQFAYHSGWRKGEIRSLEWADVDMLGKVIGLRPENSKTNEGRVLVLEGELWNVIARQWSLREFQKLGQLSDSCTSLVQSRLSPVRANSLSKLRIVGGPSRTRTCDQRIMSPLL